MGRNRIRNREETIALGEKLGRLLLPNTLIALSGDLGAGKTTFTQGIAQGLGIHEPIVSPTFVYLNIYEGRLPLFHFDLYRLKNESDFEALGFFEYFHKGGVSVIEWPERISLPEEAIHLEFIHEQNERVVSLANDSPKKVYSLLWD